MNDCKNHKKYQGVRKPNSNCVCCWQFYLRKNGKLVATLDDVADIFEILTGIQRENSDAARDANQAAKAALDVANGYYR
jgi:hypothetical protein